MFKRAVHPGEILKDELAELGVSQTAFARQIAVPPNRVSQIIAGKRSVTGDTALRFGHWIGVDPQFWLNLQTQFDLAAADQRIGAAVRELPTAAGSWPLREEQSSGHRWQEGGLEPAAIPRYAHPDARTAEFKVRLPSALSRERCM